MPNDRINKALLKATSNEDNTQYDEMRMKALLTMEYF